MSKALVLVLLASSAALAAPPKRYVLVEVAGPSHETSVFSPRFLSEADDRVPMGDGSLAGVKLSELVADPKGERATAFRRDWPADVWVGVTLSECGRKVSQTRVPGFPDPNTGANTYRIETRVEVVCPAQVTLVDAASGKAMGTTSVEGRAKSDPDNANEDDPSDAAEHDAAERAAKKALPRTR